MKKTNPRVSILSPEFVYRNAASTDLRETFKRFGVLRFLAILLRVREDKIKQEANEVEQRVKVLPIRRTK